MATLFANLDTKDIANTSVVKLWIKEDGSVVNFSRKIDDKYDIDEAKMHLGIYAYSVGILKQFIEWPVAPLEKKESLEQLRFLHNGIDIHVAVTNHSAGLGIDTEEDLMAARDFVKKINHD